ncbi:Csa1 family protein [Staphylococcus aureus]
MSVFLLIIFIVGCRNMKDEQKKEEQTNKTDSKEEQIKKSFENIDMYPIKISRSYTTKKDTEMANLKRVIKGCGRYIDFAKSNKQGGLSNEGMVLYLDRNTDCKGTLFC